MEDVVKRAVEEYMSKMEDKEQKAKGKNKRNSHETRLSGLLSKIRSKSNSVSTKQNLKRVQIKWYRRNEFSGSYQLIRVNQGGGCRSLEIDENSSFKDIKSKSTELFFDNCFKNSFGENTLECTLTICDATLTDLDEELNVFEYVRKKGFQLSKIFFVLKSELTNFNDDFFVSNDLSGTCDDDDDDVTQNNNDVSSDAALSVTRKRKICVVCGCTYIDCCLVCVQNTAFNESLSADQRKNQQELPSNITDLTTYDLFNGEIAAPPTPEKNEANTNSCNLEHPATSEELRLLRVEHFEPITPKIKKYTFHIHRTKVSTDLLNHYMKNKVYMNLTFLYPILYFPMFNRCFSHPQATLYTQNTQS